MDSPSQSPESENPFSASIDSTEQPPIARPKYEQEELQPRKLKSLGWVMVLCGLGGSFALAIALVIALYNWQGNITGFEILFVSAGVLTLGVSMLGAFFITLRFEGSTPTMKSSLLGILASFASGVVIIGLAGLAFVIFFFVACLFVIATM